ncbi:hypothetical protein FE840_007870 [Peteryoungia desertarenae]|uniref:Uncharacterized protein n=1 Tax=Peteryoungia desertarenae TaxID=1813451 RepID=A0ABX6QMI9_9HYPH|nr:hypothetical protein [Peteryoungia desertarenae]QLF69467.1 hypothetical protein FE840_007870 [Peteryoungia desertarenae]
MTENDAHSGTDEKGSPHTVSSTDQPRSPTNQARPISEEVDIASFVKELLVSDKLILDHLERCETDERT